MRMSLEGKIMLAGLEGISTRPYLDSVGVKTIGIGATKTELPDIASMDWNYEMSIPDVFKLFDKSLTKYEDAVNKTLKTDISQQQFDALVSICYNIGCGGLQKSSFMKRINEKSSLATIGQAIMMWTKPKEITGRREKEKQLYVTGKYSGGGKALLFAVKSNHKPNYSAGKEIDVRKFLVQNDPKSASPMPSTAPSLPTDIAPSIPIRTWRDILDMILAALGRK